MPVNASYEYANAEKRYLQAQTLDEKIAALEEMIKVMPGHKSAENLRANLRTRLAKFKEKQETAKKTASGSGKPGIRKEGPQAVLIGLTNSGKSSIMNLLTNTNPKIGSIPFMTREPLLGIFRYEGVRIQLIDLPAINSDYCDLGLVNSADTLLTVITQVDDLAQIDQYLKKAVGNKIIILNKTDILSQEERRKIEAKLLTKKVKFISISAKNQENIATLKKRIFESFAIIRVYTKEPNKPHSPEPFTAKPGITVQNMAEKIRKGLSQQIKETRIWGPSSKFPGQKVGPNHILMDKDVVEFHTR